MLQAMETTITSSTAIDIYCSFFFTADSMPSNQSSNYFKSKSSLWLNNHTLFFFKNVLGYFTMLTQGTVLKVLITEDLYP